MVWGGLYQEGVASKEDCETFCLDNICEVANYVASNQLCFTATDAKSNHFFGFLEIVDIQVFVENKANFGSSQLLYISAIRRINTSPSLSISGGLCDVRLNISDFTAKRIKSLKNYSNFYIFKLVDEPKLCCIMFDKFR